jgi:biotin transporter BioY
MDQERGGGMMWAGLAVGFVFGFLAGAVIMGLAAAGPQTPPDEEARLLREQMKEIMKKGNR